ncbi:MAG TPA: DUF1684 domain-containing protein [Bacteroidota bacterium]|jgi:uncharacterized protein (DUF1684 family)
MKQRPSIFCRSFAWSAALVLLLFLVCEGCTQPASGPDPAAFRKEIQEWQSTRLTRLTRDDGWLTLCGLSWLKEGENKLGSDSTNTVILPAGKAPAVAGSIWLEHGALRLQARPGSGLKYHDSVVTSMALKSDDEEPTVITLGSLSFYTIKRSDKIGVRVKDKENPARVNFKGLEYFPADPKWRFEARFEPYRPPKIIPIATMIGTTENDTCPGAIVFSVEGKEYRLEPVIETGNENQLFIMFSDATAGKETYGLGRQLYSALPDSAGKVILDFNKAYNWPCVFTVFATCPIPPRQNHLPFRVEAGEKMYSGH